MAPVEVAVIRALPLGEMLCAIPAIRALRLAGPASRLVVIGLPWAREFCARYPHYLDGFIEFPGWPGVAEQDYPDGGPGWDALRSGMPRPFDVVLQLHDDGRVMNEFAAWVPGRLHAGFVPADSADVPARHVQYADVLPEPVRLLAPLQPLGIETTDFSLELPVFEADRAEAHALLAVAGIHGQPFAIVHPGSREDARRWPTQRFAAVIDALAGRGLHVIVTGAAADRPIVDAVTARTRAAIVDLTGRTDLGALAALVDEAQVVVTNDGSVSQVAAARRTPSVVIFVGSDPVRWAPLDRSLHIPVGAGSRGGPLPTADAVIDAALTLVGTVA